MCNGVSPSPAASRLCRDVASGSGQRPWMSITGSRGTASFRGITVSPMPSRCRSVSCGNDSQALTRAPRPDPRLRCGHRDGVRDPITHGQHTVAPGSRRLRNHRLDVVADRPGRRWRRPSRIASPAGPGREENEILRGSGGISTRVAPGRAPPATTSPTYSTTTRSKPCSSTSRRSESRGLASVPIAKRQPTSGCESGRQPRVAIC